MTPAEFVFGNRAYWKMRSRALVIGLLLGIVASCIPHDGQGWKLGLPFTVVEDSLAHRNVSCPVPHVLAIMRRAEIQRLHDPQNRPNAITPWLFADPPGGVFLIIGNIVWHISLTSIWMNMALIACFVFALDSIARPFTFAKKPRASKANKCIQCGYLLIGNESGICPECGTSILKTLD